MSGSVDDARWRRRVVAAVLLATLLVPSSSGLGAHRLMTKPDLVGRWEKRTTAKCADAYPAEIEFFARPRYLGRKGAGQGFIVWDAGTYEIRGDREIRLSTATDEIVAYRFEIAGDDLTFTDAAGCVFKYHRKDKEQDDV